MSVLWVGYRGSNCRTAKEEHKSHYRGPGSDLKGRKRGRLLAKSCGDVRYSSIDATAKGWVRRGELTQQKRGGQKPKIITLAHTDRLIVSLEGDPQLTMKQLCVILQLGFGVTVSSSTVSRALDGLAYTVKKVHTMPVTMNTPANLLKRKTYVEALQNYMEEGFYLMLLCNT